MNTEEIKEHISDLEPDALLADGFEDALIGTVTIFDKMLALYDEQKCIEILVKRDGMTEEEAQEFFSFNVTGAYVGEHTPAFATLLRDEEKKDETKTRVARHVRSVARGPRLRQR